MNRKELDALAAHHGLTVDAIDSVFDMVDARPTRAEVERFGMRVLRLAGVLSIASGVVFLVAANWDALAVLGRFALVQAVLVVAVGVALWQPPPHALGRYALLFAFIVTGALLALFGQTYQTGADVYELFLSWTLLGLVFTVAAQWSVVWAAWTLVLNIALWLFCGARPETGLFWVAFALWDVSQSELLLAPLSVNALLWLVSVRLESTHWSGLAPAWLGRFALACAIAFGTWSGMLVVLGLDGAEDGVAGLLVPLAVWVAIAVHTLRRRVDVFPLAMIEGSVIVLSTAWIARVGEFEDTGTLFVLAGWLIVISTVSGHYLMRLVRAWDAGEPHA
jgi:uncharacterized membrane protein